MEKDRSWKRADYPNRPPAWLKIKLPKDPLEGWLKLGGFEVGSSGNRRGSKKDSKRIKSNGCQENEDNKSGRVF